MTASCVSYYLRPRLTLDADDNRTIICEQTSLLEAINLLLDKINNSPTPEHSLVKPFLAAILNLVLSPTYPAPRTHLLTHASWTRLVILANRTYRPCEPLDDTQHVQVGERATLASWAWKIVLAILETTPDTETTTETVIPATEDIPISERTTTDLCAPLEYFSCPSPGAAPDAETMSEDLDILSDCTTVLQILCTTPSGVRAFVPVLQNEQEAGRWLVGFVEYGDVVDGWADSEDSDSDDGGDPVSRPGEKALGRAKASLMACLAELCAASQLELFGDVGQRGGWFWDVLVRWVGSARDDLVSCALLCIGNYINDGKRNVLFTRPWNMLQHLYDSDRYESPPDREPATPDQPPRQPPRLGPPRYASTADTRPPRSAAQPRSRSRNRSQASTGAARRTCRFQDGRV